MNIEKTALFFVGGILIGVGIAELFNRRNGMVVKILRGIPYIIMGSCIIYYIS